MSSYKALYRKYRPTSFNDVVGQEHITQTLKNEIIAGRPSHAYLLMGSRGTGKTTCAKLIAKAVNCLSPEGGNPCGKCDACIGIDSGAIMDVLEIDAASNNGVDNIRELREEAVFLPASVRYRVYIIDEAHMLSMGAVNALLKIMEEPPSHVIFILATTELHKIPATILSRCQRFDFKRIDSTLLANRLRNICNMENISATDDALMLLAKLANGGMRDAISLLELAYAHSNSITEDTVIEVCGLATDDYLFSISEKLIQKNQVELYNEILKVSSQSIEYDRLCSQLIAHFRNLMLCTTIDKPDELIVCSAQVLQQLKAQAKTTNQTRILGILSELQSCAHNISTGGMSQYELEIVLVGLCEDNSKRASTASSVDSAIIKKLENRISILENRLYTMATNATTAPLNSDNPPMQTEAKVSNPPAKTTLRSAKELAVNATPFEQWYDVLEKLDTENPAIRAALMNSSAYTNNNYLLIDCKNIVFKQMINDNDFTKKIIKRVVYDITGKAYAIAPYEVPDLVYTQDNTTVSPLDRLISRAEEGGVTVTETNL